MALPGGVSVLALVAVCTIGVGVLLHLIGLATPEWSADNCLNGVAYTLGLWKVCQRNSLFDKCADYPFSLLIRIVSLTAAAFLSVVCIMIAIIVWGVQVHNKNFFMSILDPTYDIGYSFILSIIGGILIQVGGVFAFVGH